VALEDGGDSLGACDLGLWEVENEASALFSVSQFCLDVLFSAMVLGRFQNSRVVQAPP
jgi:hypothetical protein